MWLAGIHWDHVKKRSGWCGWRPRLPSSSLLRYSSIATAETRQTAQSSCRCTQTTLRGYRYQQPPPQNGQTTAGVSKLFTNHYDVAIRGTIRYYYGQFAPRFCSSSYRMRTNGVHLRQLPLSSLGLPPRSGIWFVPAFRKERTASVTISFRWILKYLEGRKSEGHCDQSEPFPLGNCNPPEFSQTLLYTRYISYF